MIGEEGRLFHSIALQSNLKLQCFWLKQPKKQQSYSPASRIRNFGEEKRVLFVLHSASNNSHLGYFAFNKHAKRHMFFEFSIYERTKKVQMHICGVIPAFVISVYTKSDNLRHRYILKLCKNILDCKSQKKPMRI